MNKRSKLSLLLGFIVIVATIMIFAISRPMFLPSTMVGFIFLLYAEFVFFGGIPLVEFWAEKSSGILARAGAGLIIEIYAAVVFTSSLIYMNTHLFLFRGFLILQIVLSVLAIILASILAMFSKSGYSKDAKVLNANAMCRNFETDLMLIREKTSNKESIDKLIDGIKYADTSSMCNADVEIHEKIKQLNALVIGESYDEISFSNTVKEIDFLIKKRNLQIKNMKQGGI